MSTSSQPSPAAERRSTVEQPSAAANAPRVSPRSLYRTFATAEMVTWALLILGMIAKYVLNLGDLPVRIGGSIHGFVFLAYCVSTVLVWTDQRWPAGKGILGLVLAIVPFATLPFEKHVEKAGLLSDQWRITRHSEEPAPGQERAATPAEKLLALILRHPILAGIALVAFVAGLFTVLLQAGPPTEWGR